jgi:hypothetical protein
MRVSQFWEVLRGAAVTTVWVDRGDADWPGARAEAGSGGGAREPIALTSCLAFIGPLFNGEAWPDFVGEDRPPC